MKKKLSILKSDDPRLHIPAKLLTLENIKTKEVQDLIDGMFNIMHSTGAVGVAATQLGIDMSVFVYGYKYRSELPQHPEIPDAAIINPVIKPLTDVMESAYEGCLSILNLRGLVPRYRDISCKYLDRYGNEHSREFQSLEARIIQHECDHLSGSLFVDRVSDLTTLKFISQ